MLRKIQFFLFIFFLFFVSVSAEENEQFASMACRFVSANRFTLNCELQENRIIAFKTTDDQMLRMLCLWIPQTKDDEYELDDKSISLLSKVDHVLVGYGQVPGNPLFYYCLPVRKVVSKMKMRVLGKYKIPLALCDYHFKK